MQQEKKPIRHSAPGRGKVGDQETQSEVRALLERWLEACRAKDIDRLMSLYSPDSVYYDTVPPLQFVGSAAIRRNFSRWFDNYEGPIGLESRDLHLVMSEEVAFAHMLLLDSGKRKNGNDAGIWVRATVCCQRSNNQWVIMHEHISLPRDPKSGMAVLDLVP
ncbi:MAG: nuclear transport factor 2 family protein [Chloroflexi bacterium]|nr:nuclear transport factor 2 family protein [Chloroflexota bacterium]